MAALVWLKSLFSWRFVSQRGVWWYSENKVTGQRKALRISRCYGPWDDEWMRPGDLLIGLDGTHYVINESARG